MPIVYFYAALFVIGLIIFLKIQFVLSSGHLANLLLLKKKGEVENMIDQDSTAYLWMIIWMLLALLTWLYSAVMLVIHLDLMRIDVIVILLVFTFFYIKQAYWYCTAEFIKQRSLSAK